MDLRPAIDRILGEAPGARWGVADTAFSPFYGNYPRAVVIAQPYCAPLPDGRYSEAAFHTVLLSTQDMLDEKIRRLQQLLDGRGIATLLPPAAQADEEALLAPFPFKRAAVEAGLGWIGKSSLLVTPEYGPRVRLGAILLDRPLACSTPVTAGSCGECRACADACPYHLITATAGGPAVPRERLLDYWECNRQRSRFITAHGRKHACGRCLLVCPGRGCGSSELRGGQTAREI